MNSPSYKLHAIETGYQRLDGGAMFGVVPKALWEKKCPADENNCILLSLRCMLLQGTVGNVLIDTGIGTKFSKKQEEIYGVQHSITLEESLLKHGLTTRDIDHVILTHLHFDHAGGATKYDNGALVPTFPHARYHVQEENWKWACNPVLRDRRSYLKENFLPLKEANQLNLLNGNQELFPGISLHMSHGHTIGMQWVEINAHDEETKKDLHVFYCADLIPTSAHINPAWHMGYDLQPLKIIDEKQELLEYACTKDAYLFFEHDPHMKWSQIMKDAKTQRFSLKSPNITA